jgi:helix-turn-helix protein
VGTITFCGFLGGKLLQILRNLFLYALISLNGYLCARNGAQEIIMSELVPILAEFMTIEELAAELGRNKRTLDRWDALGIGPPRTRVGRMVLYRRRSVQKWLAAQEYRGGAA